ncbi:MAG: 3-oxoacyl-ACP reductase FabG [Rhodospirillales bacterium]
MAGDRELAGKVAVVTGAGRNIGRAIALALAEGGAAVAVNARTNRTEAEAVAAEIAKTGGQALVCMADVTDVKAVERMAAAAAKKFGRIDILVNNAAVRQESAFEKITPDDWHMILAIVLDGAFNCARAGLPYLRKSGAGAIINIGGLTGHTGAKHRAHVVTAKAGLEGLTRALAQELGDSGITVNLVSPGLIDTPRKGPQPSHHATARTLVGRLGTPQDIAATVRFLCGPGARYITGQTIHANGGVYLG